MPFAHLKQKGKKQTLQVISSRWQRRGRSFAMTKMGLTPSQWRKNRWVKRLKWLLARKKASARGLDFMIGSLENVRAWCFFKCVACGVWVKCLFGIAPLLNPFLPKGPPRALLFDRALSPRDSINVFGHVLKMKIAVFVFCRWVDHACDMPCRWKDKCFGAF